jgi:hypothetical protein
MDQQDKDKSQFEIDMEAAGYNVVHGDGPYGYFGPMVRVEYGEYQEVVKKTKVPVELFSLPWPQIGGYVKPVDRVSGVTKEQDELKGKTFRLPKEKQ